MRDTIIIRLGDGSLLEMGGFMTTGDPIIACVCLLSDKTTNDELNIHIS